VWACHHAVEFTPDTFQFQQHEQPVHPRSFRKLCPTTRCHRSLQFQFYQIETMQPFHQVTSGDLSQQWLKKQIYTPASAFITLFWQGAFVRRTLTNTTKKIFWRSHLQSSDVFLGSVYFAIRGKSTGGANLPLGESTWLDWSCEKDNMLGLAYGLCHVT